MLESKIHNTYKSRQNITSPSLVVSYNAGRKKESVIKMPIRTHPIHPAFFVLIIKMLKWAQE